MRKNTFKGKMSKGLALVLTYCILLTGCGASDAGAASGKATWLEKATQAKNYKIYTEEEIEAKIKAAGGISSIEDAERFIELGADRLGTSKLVKIAKAM